MIFYSTNDKNMTWNMLRNETPALYRQDDPRPPGPDPGRQSSGSARRSADHLDLAVNTHGDWMYTEFATEVEMRTLKQP